MNIILLRVGIDTGQQSGGLLGPLFEDGSFEFMPVVDQKGVDERRYGNTLGRHGRRYVEYFPARRRIAMANVSMHVDPEFETFTYGDPTLPKRGLARLKARDMLVFYAGLQGWGFECPPALYLVGCFHVVHAGWAREMSDAVIQVYYSKNFHVRHASVFAEQRSRLLLVKGGEGSRMFKRAVKLGESIQREGSLPWQCISPEMAEVFGRFGGTGSIQRSNPRWVEPAYVEKAKAFCDNLV